MEFLKTIGESIVGFIISIGMLFSGGVQAPVMPPPQDEVKIQADINYIQEEINKISDEIKKLQVLGSNTSSLEELEKIIFRLKVQNQGGVFDGLIALNEREFERQISLLGILGADNFKLVAGNVYRLSGGGIGITDTSINLESLTLPVSGDEITMDDFGSVGYATIDPTSEKKEFISFTGITQNGSTTLATLTGVTRGLKFNYPYNQDTSLRQTHSGGARLIFSNPPQVFNQLTAKSNDETITGIHTFETPPIINDNNATSSSQVASRNYAQSLSNQGASDISITEKGIGKLALASDVASSTVPEGTASTTLVGIHNTNGIPNGLSTSTIPVALVNASGTPVVHPSYIATSSPYVFSQITFRGDSTTTPHLSINDRNYQFPSAGTSSPSVLVDDGTGSISYSGYSFQPGTAIQNIPISISAGAGGASTTEVIKLARNSLIPGGIIEIEANATSTSNSTEGGAENDFFNMAVSLGGKASSTCGYIVGDTSDSPTATSTLRFIIRAVSENEQMIKCNIFGEGSKYSTRNSTMFTNKSIIQTESTTTLENLTNDLPLLLQANGIVGLSMNGTVDFNIFNISVEIRNPR